MARKIPGKHGGTLTIAEKGDVLNPFGRPKKVMTVLTDFGYSATEINKTIKNMLALTISDLKKVYQDPSSSVLEVIISKSLIKGNFTISDLVSRAFGESIQKIVVENKDKNKDKLKNVKDLDEANQIYNQMIRGNYGAPD